MYVIKSDEGYYTGQTYFHEGEKYSIFDKDINKSKKYKSLKRAESAGIVLSKKTTNCCFGHVYVMEVKDDV